MNGRSLCSRAATAHKKNGARRRRFRLRGMVRLDQRLGCLVMRR
ncbi:hypothetical protein SALB1_0147 [Salinisphaera sp. LB1]|nr:hypothetical protein SALB1_0147 [Salinisphaera sp. LB1]